MSQPIGLNVVSHKKIWHVTLANFECGKLFGSMLDKNKFQDCNQFIFSDPNPEQKFANEKNNQNSGGKNEILKF